MQRINWTFRTRPRLASPFTAKTISQSDQKHSFTLKRTYGRLHRDGDRMAYAIVHPGSGSVIGELRLRLRYLEGWHLVVDWDIMDVYLGNGFTYRAVDTACRVAFQILEARSVQIRTEDPVKSFLAGTFGFQQMEHEENIYFKVKRMWAGNVT